MSTEIQKLFWQNTCHFIQSIRGYYLILKRLPFFPLGCASKFVIPSVLIFLLSVSSKVLFPLDRAMTQAFSRRPLIAEARVRSRAGACEIYDGRSGIGTRFSLGF